MLITDYFDSLGVRYWLKGKNVARNCLNITCPFCGDQSKIKIYE